MTQRCVSNILERHEDQSQGRPVLAWRAEGQGLLLVRECLEGQLLVREGLESRLCLAGQLSQFPPSFSLVSTRDACFRG